MAMSRAEIELLIKARNEAQGAFDQLNTQVKRVTGETDKASEGMDRLGKKTQGTGAAAGAAGGAFVLLAERVGTGLVRAFEETIAAANRLDSGLIGLRSVANAFKQDAGLAEDAAKRLAADGLLSVGEAATSLKNLLAAGFGLPEAVTLVERFKDSAAFGRQAALGFGQAVSSATEGIKNGNSILVDNAGVTKNLSNILVEAGFSAQDLSKASSDAGIRMALFNGIVKETNPQLGDAARYLDTAAGKQAQFSAQVEIAQQKIGKALQPALAATLEALLPLVQVVGNFATVLAPLGLAVGAVVTPLVALKGAAALGFIEMGKLSSVFTTVKAAATADVFAGVAGGLRALPGLAGSAGSAVAGIPALIAAAPWAAAAVAIGGVTLALSKMAEARANAAVAEQTAGAKQDVINRAIANGAPLVISYAGAVKFQQAVQEANSKVTDTSTEAQRRHADALLLVGKITREQYDTQIAAIQAEERRQAGLANGAALRTAISGAERKFQDEIKATGLTMNELLAALARDEDAFKSWAAQVKLSDSAIDRLKDKLKAGSEAQKKNAEEAKKAAEAQKAYAKELEQATGILTQGGLNEQLGKLERFLATAAAQGAPAFTTAVRTLWPELQKLAEQAKASGLSVSNIDGVMRQAAEGAGLITQGVRTFSTFTPLIAGVTEAQRVNTAAVREHYTAQDKVNAAYKAFGIQTPEDLRAAADAARENYATLVSSGTATTAQLKIAYQQMIEAQREATGKLPGYWETTVAPAVKRTVEQLGTAIQGTFAQVLLGAKSMGDGFRDIWDSIKASATRIFTEILADFTNRFLKGMLGALSGQQGAFGKAFGGLFGGGGGGVPGVGGGGFNIGGLFGGGGAVGLTGTGSSSSIAAAGLGLPGGGGAAGAGGLGIGAAGIAGGLGAAGAGIGLGLLGKQIFGGAGVGAGAFGAGTGAATGAAIGSIVPGLGTAVGAIIGGLAGAISGAIGKTQGEKTNDARDKFLAQFGGAGTGEGSGFLTLAQQLTEKTGEAGGGGLFNALTKAKDLKALEAAITAIVAKLQEVKPAADEAGDATSEAAVDGASNVTQLETKWKDQIRTVAALDQKASDLQQQIEAVGAEGGSVEGLAAAMELLKQQIAAAEAKAGDLAAAMRSIPGAPVSSGSTEIPIVEGGAAGGVFANRPGLVLFGEGGEQEVGGPKSFFKQVFEELGVPAGGGGGGAGAVNLNVTINALDGASVAAVFYGQIVPMLKEALRGNIGGLQTDFRVLVK
ncbi:MAG: hypothetical protein AB7S57_19530 [Acetobacteraceae bacterium]